MKHYSFDTEEAVLYGVNESILLNDMKLLLILHKSRHDNFFLNTYWVEISRKYLLNSFPFWNEIEINRSINSLINKGILNVCSNDDQYQWYSLCNKKYPEFSTPHIDGTENNKQTIPNSLRKYVFERDKFRCKKCDNHINLEVDHIYPESLGGTLEFNNLQTLCRTCNRSKGTKVLNA